MHINNPEINEKNIDSGKNKNLCDNKHIKPSRNSTTGYWIEIACLQLKHLPFWMKKLKSGILL